MMTALWAILSPYWVQIASALGAGAALLFAFLKGKAADTKVAQEQQKAAQANQATAEVRAEAERDRAADAKADAAAAQSAVDAADTRAAIEQKLDSMTHEEVQHAIDPWRKPE